MSAARPRRTTVVTRTLAAIWSRTAPRMSEGWRKRFTDHLCEYVAIYNRDIANRRFCEPPPFEEYLPFRRIVGAVYICWDLIEVAQGGSLPERIVTSDLCQNLRVAANDITCWTNDIFSLNKDYARGDVNNVVAILRHAGSLTWPEAA
ncbi:terpene synthase family protein [Streptomyces sp. R28]|uniref:Terpene synthase family protein n=1 Tax=Streptomyces sp. R28 TaxID=3238628 RepID=A0AB39PMH6_9ACTN